MDIFASFLLVSFDRRFEFTFSSALCIVCDIFYLPKIKFFDALSVPAIQAALFSDGDHLDEDASSNLSCIDLVKALNGCDLSELMKL